MTEARDREVGIEQRRNAINNSRSKGFSVDQTVLDKYKQEAASRPQRSPTRAHFEYSRDEILLAKASAAPGGLKKTRTMPDLRGSATSSSPAPTEGDAALFEGFSGLHLSSRILPHSFLKRTLPSDQFTIYRVPDLLKHVKSPDFELPDGVCDYVVIGVIASKSSPMDHKQPTNGATHSDSHTVGNKDWEKQWDDGSRNSRRFMAITLTDLQWTVDMYLFGTAVPRYHRLAPGTVVAILNPGIMPPKAGKSDTGAFSLSLSNNSDTVLEIGQARDLGYCKTIKKDGKECGSWVNRAKTEICEWHLNAEINRTKAGRMGVNTGSNGFGRKQYSHRTRDEDPAFQRRRDGLLSRDGSKYDRETGSHFYVASTGPRPVSQTAYYTPSSSSNPFISAMEGDMVRPGERDARLRKKLAAQAKEHEIATKLGGCAHSGFRYDSAGAEYLRQKHKGTNDNKNKENIGSSGTQRSAISKTILSSGSTESRKRMATDVRLSPVKKTRFVTEKGIREAGRESLGAPLPKIDDSDDELEIV
jgi:minichromosome maintenance protein 10